MINSPANLRPAGLRRNLIRAALCCFGIGGTILGVELFTIIFDPGPALIVLAPLAIGLLAFAVALNYQWPRSVLYWTLAMLTALTSFAIVLGEKNDLPDLSSTHVLIEILVTTAFTAFPWFIGTQLGRKPVTRIPTQPAANPPTAELSPP